jgi:formylglycine-generating enzyme required for sulfatase activity
MSSFGLFGIRLPFLLLAYCILWGGATLWGQAKDCRVSPGDDAQTLLFDAETTNHKSLQFCGDPDPNDPEKWININYRFGPGEGPPDFVFPANPERVPPPFFYSEEHQKDNNILTVIRFSSGAYSYLVYFGLQGGHFADGTPTPRPYWIGWVNVEQNGKGLSHIEFASANMFADMSRSLPYDPNRAQGQWAELSRSIDPEDFDAFAARFPNSDLRRLAETRAHDLRAKAAAPKGLTKLNPKDGLRYVWIPPGTFQMGCSPGDRECAEAEKPAHAVTITKGFWMGQTEVTQEAYMRITGKNNSLLLAGPLPVQVVSWNEAKAYCEQTGMRLPTEAEWEYAARGGNPSPRYGDMAGAAWYGPNSGAKIHEVGLKQPNQFGLYDMLGNLWEWTNDRYGMYSVGAVSDPQGPTVGDHRTIRGGAWDAEKPIRVSSRFNYAPDVRINIVGFRCAGNNPL